LLSVSTLSTPTISPFIVLRPWTSQAKQKDQAYLLISSKNNPFPGHSKFDINIYYFWKFFFSIWSWILEIPFLILLNRHSWKKLTKRRSGISKRKIKLAGPSKNFSRPLFSLEYSKETWCFGNSDDLFRVYVIVKAKNRVKIKQKQVLKSMELKD